ncbi:MAG: UbiA prenyltransferase family protein [Dehalococcoidia bacterium]|nr:UbiA prenyltransferase family protein [Dehalococcoidia bacterium]
MQTARYLLASSRPQQWYKNVVLFVGLVFSSNLFNLMMWYQAVLAFVLFCMVSSAEYLLNDVFDRERDTQHPTKSRRPIASGQLGVPLAVSVAVGLDLLAFLAAYLFLGVPFLSACGAYAVLALAYSAVLKRIVLVDVVVIAVGFVLRVVAGCLAIDVFPSSWLIICAFLLALLLALEKRREELTLLADEAHNYRPTLGAISVELLEQFSGIATAALLVAYMLYTFFSPFAAMWATIPFVVYGLFRYLCVVRRAGASAEPMAAFRDKMMQVNLLLWVVVVLVIVVFGDALCL